MITFHKMKMGWRSWLPVFLLMLSAAFIRLRLSSTEDYYLLEGDGPYYALQARSLAENFRLALPDVPLIFLIECLFAKIIQTFTSYSLNECILMGVRFTDVFLPPLTAIPVFFISQELKAPDSKNNFQSYLAVAFAILGFSPVIIFSHGLHKNAVAVMLVFFFLLFIIRYFKYSQKKHLYYALFTLGLCALTHFGCFSILLLFLSIAGFSLSVIRDTSPPINYRKILAGLTCLLLLILSVAVFDFGRFKRLLFIPLNIFEAPLILFAFDGQDVAAHTNMLNLSVMALLFLMAFCTLVVKRRTLNPFQKTLSFTFLLFTFLLINPFLGIEWADRLYIMAYIPITILCLILFNSIHNKWLKIIQGSIMFVLVFVSVAMGLTEPDHRIMTKDAFSEFMSINNNVHLTERSVIVGNKNLRLLGSWFFRYKSAADYTLTKEAINNSDGIYVIRQLEGDNLPKNYQRGIGEIPANSLKIYRGQHFEIYKLLNPYQWVDRTGTPKIRGIIESIQMNSITILNKWRGSRQVVRLSDGTKIFLNSRFATLKKGMYVEVWGKGSPFSLAIDADEISEVKYSADEK
jgi:hypothetical protein